MVVSTCRVVLITVLMTSFCVTVNAQDSVDTLIKIHAKSIKKNRPDLAYEPITREEFLKALEKWTQEDHPNVSPRNDLVIRELLNTHRMIFPVGLRLKTDWVIDRRKYNGIRVEFFVSDKEQQIEILIREKVSSSRILMSNEIKKVAKE